MTTINPTLRRSAARAFRRRNSQGNRTISARETGIIAAAAAVLATILSIVGSVVVADINTSAGQAAFLREERKVAYSSLYASEQLLDGYMASLAGIYGSKGRTEPVVLKTTWAKTKQQIDKYYAQLLSDAATAQLVGSARGAELAESIAHIFQARYRTIVKIDIDVQTNSLTTGTLIANTLGQVLSGRGLGQTVNEFQAVAREDVGAS